MKQISTLTIPNVQYVVISEVEINDFGDSILKHAGIEIFTDRGKILITLSGENLEIRRVEDEK